MIRDRWPDMPAVLGGCHKSGAHGAPFYKTVSVRSRGACGNGLARECLYSEREELELAETYLEDYLGMPGNYKLIDGAEKLFAGLRNQLAENTMAK